MTQITNEQFLNRWYGSDQYFLTGIPVTGGAPIRYCTVAEAIAANKNKVNIYIHANPVLDTFMGAKACTEDVAEITQIIVEVDPVAGKEPSSVKMLFEEVIVADLEKGFKPTMALETGRLGMFAFQLETPIPATEENIARTKFIHRKINKLLSLATHQTGAEGDAGTGSPEHLYKAPLVGTTAWMNEKKSSQGWKDHELGKWYWTDGPKYTLEQLEEFLQSIPDAAVAPTGGAQGGAGNGAGWFASLGPKSRHRCAQALLAAIPCTCTTYDQWARVGMALHSQGDAYEELFDQWSAEDTARYNKKNLSWKWLNGFGRTEGALVGFGSLVYAAMQTISPWNKEKWAKEEAEHVLAQIKEDAKAQKADGEQVYDNDELKEEAAGLLHVLPAATQKTFMKKVKSATKIGSEQGVGMGELQDIADDMEQRGLADAGADAAGEDEMTHDEISRGYISGINDQGGDLVAVAGETWVCAEDLLWRRNEDEAICTIASDFGQQARCTRNSDYKGIYAGVVRRSKNTDFFKDAAKGVACANGFAHVGKDPETGKDTVLWEPLTAQHRQTFRLNFDPAQGDPTLLLNALREGMGDMSDEDKEQQLRLLGQVLGVALFGLMPQEEKALFMFGPEASGKSLLLKVLEQLLPPDAVCYVPPSEMGDPKKVGPLAHSRLNLQFEAEDTAAIAGKYFKQCVAGESMQGWKLYDGTYTMEPTAATLIAGNHWPSTTDNSGGFWRRWVVVSFRHTKPESLRDKGLKNRIIETQGPQVLSWLIQGVQQYLDNGWQLDLGTQHHAGLAAWKRTRDSVAAFVHETDQVVLRTEQNQNPISKEQMFHMYQRWFEGSDYKHPVGRNKFYERVTSNHAGSPSKWQDQHVFLGYTLATTD